MFLFEQIDVLEDLLWTYLGVPIVIFLGAYLSIRSRFFQIRYLPKVLRTFFEFFSMQEQEGAVHPIKAFFAAVGGCVGIGNIVAICTAVQLGGPGALFWIWVTAIAGMIYKYSEVYLGLRYREPNGQGGYQGGPMYFLKHVYKQHWIPKFVCLLLCIYGVEVYQFSVISTTITHNFGIPAYLVIPVLLGLVIVAGTGGVSRVGNISSKSLPFFVCIYVSMGIWVLANNFSLLPGMFKLIFVSAFTGHAAVGGFAGAGLMAAMSYGIRRSCYTGDIGIGYASVIHSETSAKVPEKQAMLAIFDIFLDAFVVCTTSLFLILVTDAWQQPMEASMLVQSVLREYFPYMDLFMPIFLFILGYNTINAYFCVGLKCAEHLSVRWGKILYYVYAISAFLLFSLIGTAQAQTIMAVAGVLLLLINGYGVFVLRNEVSFELPKESATNTSAELYMLSLQSNQNI